MDESKLRKWIHEKLLFRVTPDNEKWNVETVEDEVKRLEDLGYVVKSNENGVFELVKWKFPPLSFLFYLTELIFLPALIINIVLGYRFTARVYERNGEVVTE